MCEGRRQMSISISRSPDTEFVVHTDRTSSSVTRELKRSRAYRRHCSDRSVEGTRTLRDRYRDVRADGPIPGGEAFDTISYRPSVTRSDAAMTPFMLELTVS